METLPGAGCAEPSTPVEGFARKVSSMTVDHVAGRAPIHMGPDHAKSRLARWAVGLAAAVVVVLAVSYAIFGVTWAIGGEDAVSDTFVGYLAGFALIGGLVAALAASALAIVAKVKHERWALLWLPLALFPTLLAIVVLVEALWME